MKLPFPWGLTLLGTVVLILAAALGAGHPLPGDGGVREACIILSDLPLPRDGPTVLISIVVSEVGFAVGGDEEVLPLRLQVERVRGVDPTWVRRLLGENRTLGEIKAEIEGADGAYTYRGNLRLGRSSYLLDRLNLTEEVGNDTLEADLMVPVGGWGAIPPDPRGGLEMAGRVSLETVRREGSEIRAGSLVIFGGPDAGSYAVIIGPAAGRGMGGHHQLGSEAWPDEDGSVIPPSIRPGCWMRPWPEGPDPALRVQGFGFSVQGSSGPAPIGLRLLSGSERSWSLEVGSMEHHLGAGDRRSGPWWR